MDQQTVNLDQLANALKTLANLHRLQIVWMLSNEKELNVTTIQAQLQMAQSLVSHHLIKMKDKGILQTTRKKKEIYYSLVTPNLLEKLLHLTD